MVGRIEHDPALTTHATWHLPVRWTPYQPSCSCGGLPCASPLSSYRHPRKEDHEISISRPASPPQPLHLSTA
jgi:hypothetical protein